MRADVHVGVRVSEEIVAFAFLASGKSEWAAILADGRP
jgi:hypothetical protein